MRKDEPVAKEAAKEVSEKVVESSESLPMKDTEKLENVFETDGVSFETTATEKEDSPTMDQNTKGEPLSIEVDENEEKEESPITEETDKSKDVPSKAGDIL